MKRVAWVVFDECGVPVGVGKTKSQAWRDADLRCNAEPAEMRAEGYTCERLEEKS